MVRISLDDPHDYLDWRVGSGGSVEIFDLAVGSERRRGRGRELVCRLLRAAPPGTRRVWALTRAGNEGAHAFYVAVGFRLGGAVRAFYPDRFEGEGPEDAAVFIKDLE